MLIIHFATVRIDAGSGRTKNQPKDIATAVTGFPRDVNLAVLLRSTRAVSRQPTSGTAAPQTFQNLESTTHVWSNGQTFSLMGNGACWARCF